MDKNLASLRTTVSCCRKGLRNRTGSLVVGLVLAVATLFVGGQGCSNGAATISTEISPLEILEKAQQRSQNIEFVHIESENLTVTLKEGSLEKLVLTGSTDFHAPDKSHTISHGTISVGSRVSDILFEGFGIGSVQYLKNGEAGHWIAVIPPPSILELRNRDPVEGMMADPEAFDDLKLDGSMLDGRDIYKISGTIPPGVETDFQDSYGDRSRYVEYWVTPGDLLIRKFVYSWGNPPDREGQKTVLLLSKFNEPVEIRPPDVTPVPLPER